MKHVYADGEWFTGPFERGGMDRYVHIVRAPDDPERKPREERRGKEMEWRTACNDDRTEQWEEAILTHLSDGEPRTFNRMLVEMCDMTADVAFEKAPDKALWHLVDTYRLEFRNEAPILFRRPPGFEAHFRMTKGTTLSVCGRATSLWTTGESVYDTWDEVTCLACHQLKTEHTLQQEQAKEDDMSFKPRTKTATAKPKKAPKPKKEEVKDPVNPVLADGARRQLANALIAARKRGEKIVQGHCMHCGAKGDGKTCCILCAFSYYKDQEMDEQKAAKLLMVPERWLLDVISGFDKDGDEITYPSAKRLGAKLWRKYGAQKKARA